MSNFSVYKTSVGNITVDMLRSCLQALAKEIGAELGNTVKDYYNTDHAVQFSLKTRGLPRGIGFSVQNNKLMVHGDGYGVRNEWDRTKTLVENYVKARKLAQQTLRAHPQAQINMRLREREVIMEANIP